MNSKQKQSGTEPSAYPVLPLHTTVVFPRTVATLHITRKQSLNLIIENKDNDGDIVLVLAHDVSSEEVKSRDLHRIGVLARIVKIQDSLKGVSVQAKVSS